MDSHRYAAFLPTVLDWLQRTLEAHAGEKRPVASFRFSRLPRYFSPELLNTASVVITELLPVPPLSALGLTEFAAFERQPMSGITYLDTYFLLPDGAGDESLHSHELIHVIQCQVLGPRDFLLLWPLDWPNGDIWTARSKRRPTGTSADSIVGSRRIRSRRKWGQRR